MRRFWAWLTVPRFAAILFGFAAVAVVLYVATNRLDAWLPNIGVGAVSIAITALVVEELLRRAELARVAGRVTHAQNRIGWALQGLMTAAQIDYIRWRGPVDTEIGGNVVEILARWLEAGEPPVTPTPLASGERPYILEVALEFADEVQHVAEEAREHLPDELVTRLSDIAAERRAAEAIPSSAQQLTSESVDIYRARVILQSAKHLAEAYGTVVGAWPWYLKLDRGVLPAAGPGRRL